MSRSKFLYILRYIRFDDKTKKMPTRQVSSYKKTLGKRDR